MSLDHQDGNRLLPQPVDNPGLPEHEPRPTDIDEAAAKRAELQVSSFFGGAALLLVLFCVFYFLFDTDDSIFGFNASNLTLGLCLGLALLFIGLGAIQWAKKLMADHEIVEMRHPIPSTAEAREEALEAVTQGVHESSFGRRKMIQGSLLGALGALGLPAVVLLRDLGPIEATDELSHTIWTEGMRVVVDVSGQPLRPSDIAVGDLVNGEPELLVPDGDEEDQYGSDVHVPHGTELLQEKAKAAVILVRLRPEDIRAPQGQEDWAVEGIMCFSKICTHVGCPISLYEQQTKQLLCPCHQSTFDLADGGKVTFGPAHRPLPQLPLGVDSEGYLIAMSDFTVPVGPSWPTMPQDGG